MAGIVRIRDLSSEISLSGDIYLPVDKDTYVSNAKKITLNDIAAYVIYNVDPISGLTYDLNTGDLTLETLYGYYVTNLENNLASGMTDVWIDNPQNNEILVYDNGYWVNSAATFSGNVDGTLSGLTDTVINSPLSGQSIIFYNDVWINSDVRIGMAEDGDYTDGLFTDFTDLTTVGTAVDRFNEILKALAPPPAPLLDNTSIILGGTVQTSNGKLSFGTDNDISGYYSDSKTVGTLIKLSAGDGNETGVFNESTPAHSYAYPANAFRNEGEIKVRCVYSGTTYEHVVDLDTIPETSYNNTVANITINLAAALPVKFQDNTDFEQFKYRTGSWSISYNNFDNGINNVEILYESSIIGSDEFAVDKDITPTTVSSPLLSSLIMLGSKYLSGVEYYTSGTATYTGDINDAYKNTYQYNGNISFTTSNCSVPSSTIADVSGPGSESIIISLNKTATITASRLLDESIGVRINVVDRTLDRDDTPANLIQYINNILMDNVPDNSTNTKDYFNGENYRLKDVVYSTTSDITSSSNVWDSHDNLTGITGLQIYGGDLVYPSIDFSSIINGPVGNPNYSGLSGARTFVRKYYLGTGVSNMVFKINGSGSGSFKATTDTTGNYIHVEISTGKSPGPSLTGWKDAYRTVANGGCYSSTYGDTKAFGGDWGITFGTDGTAYSSGYAIVRLTTNSSIIATDMELKEFVP